MAITRKALLISNPGEIGDENYCSGVYVDIRKFTRLLKSAHGGAWTNAEIQTFDRPTKRDLAVPLSNCEHADYAFILFTGHGAFSQGLGEPILEFAGGYNSAPFIFTRSKNEENRGARLLSKNIAPRTYRKSSTRQFFCQTSL